MGKLVLVVVFCTLFSLVSSGGTIALLPDSARVAVDSTVAVTVSALDVASVHGYSVTISYDPARVRCVRAVKKPFLTGQTLFFFTIDSVNGTVKIDEAILGTGAQSGSGAMAQVEFTGRQAGQTPLGIAAADVRDAANQSISVTTAGSVVTVTGTTGIGQGEELPLQFGLGQNFPNPCNPSTVIPYALAQTGHVTVAIVSVLGEHVATLVDEVQSAGHHAVRWEPFRGSGRLASGTYLCLLRAGDIHATVKILVLK